MKESIRIAFIFYVIKLLLLLRKKNRQSRSISLNWRSPLSHSFCHTNPADFKSPSSFCSHRPLKFADKLIILAYPLLSSESPSFIMLSAFLRILEANFRPLTPKAIAYETARALKTIMNAAFTNV